MLGFTSGAVKQVQDFANANLRLLFGQEDVNAMIEGKSSFDDLLGEKRHQLVTRRLVWVMGNCGDLSPLASG